MSENNVGIEKMKQWEKEVYQRSILQAYDRVPNKDSAIGTRITKLWNEFSKFNTLSFRQFEELLNDLIQTYIMEIDPQEGMSGKEEKIIYNKMTDKYFHYIKIKRELIEKF